jgi:hypothetical protein
MPRPAHRRLTTEAVGVDLRDLKTQDLYLRLPRGGYAQRLAEHITIDWHGMRLTVPLAETTPQFGGRRFWFYCRQCGRRARIVYSPDFHCRHCSGVLHPSTRQTTRDRAIDQAVRLRRGLGGSGSLLEPFPPKPKEMRPALWLKLFSKCQKYEQKSLLSAPAAIAELSARLVPALKVRRKKQQVETRTRNGAKL